MLTRLLSVLQQLSSGTSVACCMFKAAHVSDGVCNQGKAESSQGLKALLDDLPSCIRHNLAASVSVMSASQSFLISAEMIPEAQHGVLNLSLQQPSLSWDITFDGEQYAASNSSDNENC